MTKICSNTPCPVPATCKGRCNKCYKHWKRYGMERPLVAPAKQTVCSNPYCGDAAKFFIKGRCSACYQFWLRNGRDRTEKKHVKYDQCQNCDRPEVYRMGRCKRCYHYRYSHGGAERPNTLPDKKPSTPHKCSNPNCYKIVKCRSRCSACQNYLLRNQTERPSRLINRPSYRWGKVKPRACRVCKAKKIAWGGRCLACASYYRRNKASRPRYLWDPDATCLGECGVLLRMQANPRRGYCLQCYLELRKSEKKSDGR